LALDVTDRHRAAERQQLLMREVDHRAKNALAVMLAALRLTRAPDLPSYKQALEGRVSALARAQTLLADDCWAGADLLTLLRGELGSFFDRGSEQVELQGPTIMLPPARLSRLRWRSTSWPRMQSSTARSPTHPGGRRSSGAWTTRQRRRCG
jgi:two-component sensor histidine kinase